MIPTLPMLLALAAALRAAPAGEPPSWAAPRQGESESRPTPVGSAPSSAARSERWPRVAATPVGRFGVRDVTIGEITAAAETFYPSVYTELDSGYGGTFFASGTFDDWIDAYFDLLALERDPRVPRRLPDSREIEKALVARAVAPEPGRLAAYFATSPSGAPREPTKSEVEKARRFLGFDVARQVQLDKLVPARTDEAELRRILTRETWKLNVRLRVRHLLLPIRDEVTEKRFPRERRANVMEDAERLLVRLRQGEPFEAVVRQVQGPRELRPKDTLPWLSYDAPLPMRVLRALFEAEKGACVGPIETRDGIYVGLVEDRERVALREFTFLRDRWIQVVRRDEQFDLLEKLRSEVSIVIF